MNEDIRPLKDVLEIKGGFAAWPVVILILAAIIVVLWIYFNKRKKPKEIPGLPPRPAAEIAKEALDALKRSGLIEKGLIKEYYIRLSDIIRSYIENIYKIAAMDKTTWELFQEMKSRKIERARADKINDFLEDCDMVKFAKYAPNQKEIELIHAKAEEIINMTVN